MVFLVRMAGSNRTISIKYSDPCGAGLMTNSEESAWNDWPPAVCPLSMPIFYLQSPGERLPVQQRPRHQGEDLRGAAVPQEGLLEDVPERVSLFLSFSGRPFILKFPCCKKSTLCSLEAVPWGFKSSWVDSCIWLEPATFSSKTLLNPLTGPRGTSESGNMYLAARWQMFLFVLSRIFFLKIKVVSFIGIVWTILPLLLCCSMSLFLEEQ